ncbi:hypothetical protein niasHT_034660 [Heterodera trifolii]|uniref:Uncharacterized protein n=1 Tax=Heterodera trifolii TaxID=157864 RepID=A0ABD2ILR9_9BILA
MTRKGANYGRSARANEAEADAGREAYEAEEDDDDGDNDYSPFAGDQFFLPVLWKPIFWARQFTLETFCTLHREVMGLRNTRAGTLRDCEMTICHPKKCPAQCSSSSPGSTTSWLPRRHLPLNSQRALSTRLTSRLLMNLIMLRRGYHPVILPEKKRDEYYTWLEEASDNNNIEPFISFHQQCAQDLEPAPSLPSSSS